MPDLSTLSSTQSPLSPHNPDSLTGTGDWGNGEVSGGEIRVLGFELGDMSGGGVGEKSVVGNGGEEYLKRCGRSGHGLELGLSGFGRSLSFLVSAPKAVSCRTCSLVIDPGDEVSCCVRGCPGVYHKLCARARFGWIVPKKFKCPQHACFLCKQKPFWRCIRCELASHDKCSPWPDKVIYLNGRTGWVVCWRHPKDWRLE